MNKYSFENINSVWMKPIKRTDINPEDITDVNTISMILINEFSDIIHNVTNRIIYQELCKRPKANLHQQLLIKRQVINNVSENITSITINMAKDKLDIIRTQPEFPVVEQVEMTYDNFDANVNNNFYSYLDDDNSMQVDYNNEDEVIHIM